MNIAELKKMARRDFNNAVALICIIPVLGFVYLIVGKSASLSALEGEAGYVMLILLVLIMLGIYTGRRLLWYLITKIVSMENELVEKGRLAAISETVLSLAHEIRNPLTIVIGNLELLMGQANADKNMAVPLDRVNLIKTHCDRITDVMDKMSRISKPSFITFGGNIKMLDLPTSELKK